MFIYEHFHTFTLPFPFLFVGRYVNTRHGEAVYGENSPFQCYAIICFSRHPNVLSHSGEGVFCVIWDINPKGAY